MFEARKTAGAGALMPFITAGYPDSGCTGDLLSALADSGADAVEIGIPFSDPIADGPVIAASMHEALGLGVTPTSALNDIATVRPRLEIPILVMVSISIVQRMGGTEFVRMAAGAGVDGLIVPDADLNDIMPIVQTAADHDMAFSTLIAPDTPEDRLNAILQHAREFVYLLARRGLTGERSDAPDLAPGVAAIRRHTDIPIAAGFGIATPEHVHAVLEHAQGAIVGSRLVRALAGAKDDGADLATTIDALVRPLAEAAHAPLGS
ncbi:MAG: tryptophan synthase subunit alpha [Phycisphaerales bacterium]|nr:tryptophan synthase subunit alpha [Phycisphaerales bacterium]